MAHDLSGFSRDFARGGIDRRQVIKGLGITATAAFAAAVAPKATAGLAGQIVMTRGVTGFKAVAYNHINYQVPDYAKVRDFYVSLLGMKPVWDDGKQWRVANPFALFQWTNAHRRIIRLRYVNAE